MNVPLLEKQDSASSDSPDGNTRRRASQISDETKEEVTKMLNKLPDLKEKLAETGKMDDYMRFREGYLLWRTGAATGAVGELTQADDTELSAVKKEQKKEAEEKLSDIFALFGTIDAFNWQKTFSFWVAVHYIVGCWLFVFTSFLPCVRWYWPKEWKADSYVQWIANLFFSAGITLMWFTVANVKRSAADGIIWNPFEHRRVKEHLAKVLPHEEEETLWGTNMPYYIAINYILGGLLYNSATLAPLFELTEMQEIWLDIVPVTVGGFLFWVGGGFEMIGCMYFVKPGTRWYSPSRWEMCPMDIEKFCTWNNMLGGFLFFLPPFIKHVPFLCDHVYGENHEARDWWTGFLWGVGSLMFVAGSGLQIWLWKGDSFGMAYMHQLNSINDKSKHGKGKKLGFSIRGTAIVLAVTLLSAISILNICMHFQAMMFDSKEAFTAALLVERAFKMGRNVLPFVLFMMYLTLLSAQIHLPKVQPYRGLMVITRLMVPLMGFYLIMDYLDVYAQLMCQKNDGTPFCPL